MPGLFSEQSPYLPGLLNTMERNRSAALGGLRRGYGTGAEQARLDLAPVGAVGAPSGLLGAPGAPPRGMTPLQSGALATMFTPGLGDVLGLAADAEMYATRPETRTLGNFGLSALGMLPFVPGMTFFHGSPHKFDKFKLADETIGTGEGAQAYGHGLYFAEDPKIAGHYKNALARPDIALDGANITSGQTPEQISKYMGIPLDDARAIKGAENYIGSGLADNVDDAIKKLKASSMEFEKRAGHDLARVAPRLDIRQSGHLYEVDIPEEQVSRMLDWDAPLSEQPEGVREALQRIADQNPQVYDDPIGLSKQIQEFETPEEARVFWDKVKVDWVNTPNRKDRFKPRLLSNRKIEYYPPSTRAFGNATGGQILESLRRTTGDDALISTAMSNAGIPGIKYFDATSRYHPASLPDNPIANEARKFLDQVGGDVARALKAFDGSNPVARFATTERDEVRRVIKAAGKAQTRNLVVFDDSIIETLKRNEQPIGLLAE